MDGLGVPSRAVLSAARNAAIKAPTPTTAQPAELLGMPYRINHSAGTPKSITVPMFRTCISAIAHKYELRASRSRGNVGEM